MGKEVLEVLRSKHLEVRPASNASINRYMGAPPDFVPLYTTEYTAAEVGRSLSGGAILGVSDNVSLHNWILCYGEESAEIRHISTSMTE